MLDEPAPIEQHADLAPNLVADFGQVPGELLGDQPIGRHPTPEEAFDLASLTGLEALTYAPKTSIGGASSHGRRRRD